MARLDAEYEVTRADLEDLLREEGFVQQPDAHIWLSQDRTKFVSFPDSDSGEAIYGDAEIGEPGRMIPIRNLSHVLRGNLLLESPLGVSSYQRQPEAARILGTPEPARALETRDAPRLPSANPAASEAEFEEEPAGDPHA